MVEPVDPRGVKPLTRTRRVDPSDSARRRRKRQQRNSDEDKPSRQGEGSRLGRNIDERA